MERVDQDNESIDDSNNSNSKKINILDELNEKFSNLSGSNMSGFGDYTQQTQHYSHMPDNQFAHAWGLINVRMGKLKEFDDLMNPHLFLGSVEDPKSLRFYQNDNFFLTNLFRLAQNDEAMRYVFEPLWNNFIAELRLTGTLDGGERIYQAFKIPRSQPKGFRIFGKSKKKKKEPLEYIIPDEEDQGMY